MLWGGGWALVYFFRFVLVRQVDGEGVGGGRRGIGVDGLGIIRESGVFGIVG